METHRLCPRQNVTEARGVQTPRQPRRQRAGLQKPPQNTRKPLHCPGFAVQNTSVLAHRQVTHRRLLSRRRMRTRGGRGSPQQGKHAQPDCLMQRNSISRASRPTSSCLEAPTRLQANDWQNNTERGVGGEKKKIPLTFTTGTISALITHPELGSLQLNLHFKHDLKNTPLCFPPKITPRPCGKKLFRLLETEPRLGAGPIGPADPRGELGEGQTWLSPCLQPAAVCPLHCPWADTSHACHS